MIETGEELGDMTSELHPSENISEFVDTKNYEYMVLDT